MKKTTEKKGAAKMREKLKSYQQYLVEQELAESTIRTYLRHAEMFVRYAGGRGRTRRMVLAYKKQLMDKGYKISTVNLAIIAVNKYLRFCGQETCTVRTNRQQCRKSLENVISESEYRQLLDYAEESGREKYYLIMRTLALTGSRVGELQYITVEMLTDGYTLVSNKGKTREIYVPECLAEQIRSYCKREKISKGAVFRGCGERPISRTAVWKMLQHLADMAGVDKRKVHPHSFRHFFALSYMKHFSNIFELADILGHSSLETTRIYTTASVEQKRERMGMLDERQKGEK